MSHRRFEGMWCCRVSVPFEESYFLVDQSGIIDCFPTYEAAFSAGSKALITVLNNRIVLPKKKPPAANQIVQRMQPCSADGFLFGFFDESLRR